MELAIAHQKTVSTFREMPWTKAESEAVCKQYETYPTLLGFDINIGSNSKTDQERKFYCSCIFPGGKTLIAPPNFDAFIGSNNTVTEMVVDGTANATCYDFSCKDNCSASDAVSVLVMNHFC